MKFLPKHALGAALVVATACAPAGGQGLDSASVRRAEQYVNAVLNSVAEAETRRAPEMATRLGLSREAAGFDYQSVLNNRSQAAFERARLDRLEALARLEAAPSLPPGHRLETTVDTVHGAHAAVIEIASFGHGRANLTDVRPYAADQLSGAYSDLPDLFANRTILSDPLDARRFLNRLSGVAAALDDERMRLFADARAGVAPPRFILDRMIDKASALSADPAETHIIAVSFDNLMTRVPALGPDDRSRLHAEAVDIIRSEIQPAYARYIDDLQRLREEAAGAGGVWALPKGDAYYVSALRFFVGPDASPDDLHDRGQAEVDRLVAELDVALADVGFTDGSVGERLAALALDESQLFSPDEAGRAQIVEALQSRMAWIETRLRDIASRPPRTQVSVVRVPEFLEPSAPGAYYAPAPADGVAPGLFLINLRDPAEWPAFSLPTLAFHEAIPGHHLESAVAAEQGQLPMVRRMIWPAAYGEGWALYAEDLGAELGAYDDDPYGRIGYLQSLLFRAARLVADTGLHRKRWTRGETVDYLVAVTGQPRTAMETEVDRYAVWPGQAAAYMVGWKRFQAMRARAQGALGSRFDLADFHQTILVGGPRPLHLVERDVDAWVERQLR
ncbi:MAG: DUF885 domain-containing protein [Pseudomonadota bacterium]